MLRRFAVKLYVPSSGPRAGQFEESYVVLRFFGGAHA